MTKNFIITAITLLIMCLCLNAQQDGEVEKDVYKNKGFFNITKLSYSVTTKIRQELFIPDEGNIFRDVDPDGSNAWSLHTINGFFISPTLSVGLGVGLENHDNPNFNVLPIFLDARAYLTDDAQSLYTFLDVGPTIRLGGDESGLNKGVIFNFGIGYKFQLAETLFIVSDAFYSHKTVSLTDEGIGTSDDIVKVNGFGISLGAIF